MSSDNTSSHDHQARDDALHALATSAVRNIPGVEFASITVLRKDKTLRTVASTDALANQIDAVQYELREGPCYAAVTDESLIVINDVAAARDFPRYGPRAADLGVQSQTAIHLFHNGERAGLNLYARTLGAFDPSTVELAELFATQAGALLGYARQVDQLSEALHTRTDIGIAIGMVMERYGMDREQAFAFLVRHSSTGNVKLRTLARQVIDRTFASTPTGTAKS